MNTLAVAFACIPRAPCDGGGNCEGILGEPLQPSLGRVCSSQVIHQNVSIHEVHEAGRFQPSARSFCANSGLSSMSARSRHIPKNSDLSRSPKVEGVEGPGQEIVTAIAADPAGTSAGSVTRNSRLAGISEWRLIVLTMGVFPQCNISKATAPFQRLSRMPKWEARSSCFPNSAALLSNELASRAADFGPREVCATGSEFAHP
jgi:hypothetical protein